MMACWCCCTVLAFLIWNSFCEEGEKSGPDLELVLPHTTRFLSIRRVYRTHGTKTYTEVKIFTNSHGEPAMLIWEVGTVGCAAGRNVLRRVNDESKTSEDYFCGRTPSMLSRIPPCVR